jgi:tetratricopeptide (TPR) repeat protein
MLVIIVLLIAIPAASQAPQERSPLDGRTWGVVYDVPATKQVKIRSDVPYSGRLTIDIYSPPNLGSGARVPAVVFLNAIGDQPGNKLKSWGIYSSFPRLVAAHGLIGISMEADGAKIQENLRDLFAFLERDGARHGIDGSRIGVYAASANVAQSAIFLLNDNAPKNVKAAALYYGGAPEMRPRRDLPVLFIIAEGDMPRMASSLPGLWQRIAETRAPWTLLMATGQPHAFDAFANNDDSRRIIQQTLAFWKSHLEPVPQPDPDKNSGRDVLSAIYWNENARAMPLLIKYLENNPNDATAHMQYARMLQQAQRYDEALVSFEKVKSLNPADPTSYGGIGQIRFSQKRYDEAVIELSAAVERGYRSPMIFGQLAYSQLALGQNENAIKSYEQAFAIGIPPGATTRGLAYYNMACAYARLNNKEKAFEMLGKAIDEGFVNRSTFETDTDLAALRSDPRFAQLLARTSKPAN